MAAPYYIRFRIWWCHSHPKVKQNLSANQISSRCLHPRLRCNYFWFGKQTSAILEFFFLLLFWPDRSNLRAITKQIPKFRSNGPPAVEIGYYVAFKDGGRCAAILLPVSRFRSGDVAVFSDVTFYLQTKFRSYNSIRSWDITISGFEKQTSAILELYFRFGFRPHHRSRHVTLHQSAKFYPNRTALGRKMT